MSGWMLWDCGRHNRRLDESSVTHKRFDDISIVIVMCSWHTTCIHLIPVRVCRCSVGISVVPDMAPVICTQLMICAGPRTTWYQFESEFGYRIMQSCEGKSCRGKSCEGQSCEGKCRHAKGNAVMQKEMQSREGHVSKSGSGRAWELAWCIGAMIATYTAFTMRILIPHSYNSILIVKVYQ